MFAFLSKFASSRLWFISSILFLIFSPSKASFCQNSSLLPCLNQWDRPWGCECSSFSMVRPFQIGDTAVVFEPDSPVLDVVAAGCFHKRSGRSAGSSSSLDMLLILKSLFQLTLGPFASLGLESSKHKERFSSEVSTILISESSVVIVFSNSPVSTANC